MNFHPYVKFAKLDKIDTKTLALVQPWPIAKLCRAYSWPTALIGGGKIAIIELGGGWTPSDVAKACVQNTVPIPSMTDISVDGTSNSFGQNPDSDGEVALDIQVAAISYSVATGKPATIGIFWAQDITKAIRAVADAGGYSVCSISWGADEKQWGVSALWELQKAVQYANARGVIIFAASGDNDSSDGGPGPANVDAPASSMGVVACGGTTKYHGVFASDQVGEVLWNNNPGQTNGEGTGGGFSTLFPMQSWQIGVPNGPGRMVSDLSANADPNTGYLIWVNGQEEQVGGTSAVAPLYAGLFAAFGHQKDGLITPKLYLNPLAFNKITIGNNGQFGANICCGLGSPIGTKLASIFAPTSS